MPPIVPMAMAWSPPRRWEESCAATLGNVIDGRQTALMALRWRSPPPPFPPSVRRARCPITFGDVDVAGVVHIVAQAHEAIVEPGVAHCARPHVDAAALLARVHGHADDLDGGG